MNQKKIILGFSGSKQSIVAASLLKSQNVELIAFHFRFDSLSKNAEHESLFPKLKCVDTLSITEVEELARQCDLELKIIDLSGELIYELLDPLIESRLTTTFINPCESFFNKIIIKTLNQLKENLHADEIATGSHEGYPLKEIPDHLIEKLLQKLNLKSESLKNIQNPHTPETCFSELFWKTPTFNEVLPDDLKLNGRYYPFFETYPPEHGGVFHHSIGDALNMNGAPPVVVSHFQYSSRTWILKPLTVLASPKKWDALYKKDENKDESIHSSAFLTEFMKDQEYILRRDRKNKSTAENAFRVKIYPYLKNHVSIDFLDPVAETFSKGETFSFNKDHHPNLKGSFILVE